MQAQAVHGDGTKGRCVPSRDSGSLARLQDPSLLGVFPDTSTSLGERTEEVSGAMVPRDPVLHCPLGSRAGFGQDVDTGLQW